MTTLSDARQALAIADGALRTAGLPVVTTTPSTNIAPHLLSGAVVVVANPPRLQFETWDHALATWEFWLVTGPADPAGHDDAWDTLDRAIAALRLPLSLDEAEPTAYQDATGTAWPAYRLTTTNAL